MEQHAPALTVVEADGTKRPWSLNELRHAVRVAVCNGRPLPGNDGADQLYLLHDGGLLQCATRHLGSILPGATPYGDACQCELVAVRDGGRLLGFTFPKLCTNAFEYRRAGDDIDYEHHVLNARCELHCRSPNRPVPVRDRFGNFPNEWTEVRGMPGDGDGFLRCEHCGAPVAHWPDY